MTTVPVQRRPGVPREMVRLIEGRYTLYGVELTPRPVPRVARHLLGPQAADPRGGDGAPRRAPAPGDA